MEMSSAAAMDPTLRADGLLDVLRTGLCSVH